jgi:hypothetical protein
MDEQMCVRMREEERWVRGGYERAQEPEGEEHH